MTRGFPKHLPRALVPSTAEHVEPDIRAPCKAPDCDYMNIQRYKR